MKLLTRSFVFIILTTLSLQVAAQRWIGPNDVYRVNNIGAPKISPEGKWILYSHGTVDSAKDKVEMILLHNWITENVTVDTTGGGQVVNISGVE